MFSVDDPDGMELRFIIENWKEMEPRDENGQNEQDLIEYKRKERIQKLLKDLILRIGVRLKRL